MIFGRRSRTARPCRAGQPSAKFLQIAGRLRSGVSPEQARAELATIADRLEEAYPGENANLTMRMASLIDETVGECAPRWCRSPAQSATTV
jgi:hypothetical protein